MEDHFHVYSGLIVLKAPVCAGALRCTAPSSYHGRPPQYIVIRGEMQVLMTGRLIEGIVPFLRKNPVCNVLLAFLLSNLQGNW